MAQNILAPLEITVPASAIAAGIQKQKKAWIWNSNLIISNKEMNDIMKTVQALDFSNILLKGITKTIKNKTKEQKRGFLGMLFGTLRASLLGKMLA